MQVQLREMPVTKVDFISKTTLYRTGYPLDQGPRDHLSVWTDVGTIYAHHATSTRTFHSRQALPEISGSAHATHLCLARKYLAGMHYIISNKTIIKAHIIQMPIQSIMCYGILL